MERSQIIISRVILTGVLLALSLVMIGGIFDLYHHGNYEVNYATFKLNTNSLLAVDYTQYLIELGLVVLIITQMLRVAIAGWFYLKLQDYFFTLISLFIIVVMLVSFLWAL